jgi:DMSO/TMAO reductase YedYZ molybdopterin-dependent catalytic subunit
MNDPHARRNPAYSLARRKLLFAAPLALLAGCDLTPEGRVESTLRSFQGFNDWVQGMVFDPAKLVPEYADAEATPLEGFRVNDYDTDRPEIDMENWSLAVEGLVREPGNYALADVARHPKRVMNTRHCCVEGWSMIPKWGGTPAREFMRAIGADLTAKYVAVECGDEYWTSYDMASFLHPQTLLCYEAYGKPLDLEHGAPLRVVMPVKLGYKSAKWISKIVVTNDKPGGYWEDQGYDWFAGL